MVLPIDKQCRECGESKPLEEFPVQPQGRQGRHPLCKPCRAAQERARYHRERDRLLERMASDPQRKRRVRWRALERKYGLAELAYEAMWVRQQGACAICHVRQPLLVDHDHGSGEVRGLLCRGCNLGIGTLEDDSAVLRAAARYLRASGS